MKETVIELMLSKTFENLTAEEKQLVLSQMTRDEYETQRSLLLSAKSSMQEESKQLQLNSGGKQNVLAALQAKNQAKIALEKENHQKKEKGGFFAVQIPLWSAAAAVFMVFFLTTPIFMESHFNFKKDTPLMATVDTVYIDKIVRDTIEIDQPLDTVVKTIYVNNNEMSQREIVNEKIQIENEKTRKRIDFNIKSEQIFGDLEMKMANSETTSTFNFSKHKAGRSLSEDKIGKLVLNSMN